MVQLKGYIRGGMTILPAVLCAFILSASFSAPARAEEITERQPDVTTDRTVDVENTYKNIQANEDGGVFLVRSTLTFNAAATFLNNASERSGGAIYIAGKEGIAGTVNFNADATFTKNSAGNGGAVFNESALNFNGGTYTFENNAATANVGNGGAIYNAGRINFGTDDKRVSLTFTNNTAMEGGGAIFNTNGGVVTIKGDATFSGDADAEAVMKYGGAIRNFKGNASGSQFIVDGTAKFDNNKASWGGGALSNDEGVRFSVSDKATFTKNSAGKNGGAIYNKGEVSFGGLAEFNGNKTDNATETYGGAFYNHTTGTFTANAGAKFTDNETGTYGGALYNNGKAFFGGKTYFESNTVSGEDGKGGAIYNGTGGVLTFADDVSFIKNKATGNRYSDGGAIYNAGTINFGTNDKRVTLTFDQNTSENSGGAIFNVGNVITIKGTAVFTGNTTAKYGGALRNYKASDTAPGAQFIVDGDATFSDNKALLNGGAISNSEDSLFSVSGNATFENNFAGENGGAISSMGTLVFGKENETSLTKFLGNTAQGSSGGAVFNYTSGTLTFYGDAAFNGNTSGVKGGAIFNEGTLNFYGSSYTFANNTAESGTPNDIYNNGNKGVMNIGVAGKTTDFYVSHVTGTGTTDILGNVNLNAANAEKTIDWQNHIVVDSGATLTVNDAAVFSEIKNTSIPALHIEGGGTLNFGVLGTVKKIFVKGNDSNWTIFNEGNLFAYDELYFTSNTTHQGAVFRNKGNAILNAYVKFVGNTSTANGAITNWNTMEINDGALFDSNHSSGYGAALANTSGATLTFNVKNASGKKVVFSNNVSDGSTGAIQNQGTLIFNANADFFNNRAAGVSGAVYNVAGTINFNASSYEFKNNKVGDSYGDIYNNGNILIGNDKTDTSFTISFVDGSGVTEFRGGKTVEMRAASGNVISFKNNVTVKGGTTLGIGQNLFDMGDKNLTLTSEGTLKLTISDLTAGASDYTGGQFKTAGTATIGGTLFVTIDPSVSLIGETGELTLVDAGTFSGAFADWKISNGYTIRYVGDGKFIIGKRDEPDPTPPSPPDPNPPAPTPEPPAQDTEFVKPAKEVAISDVRAGVAQIADRLSSLGASMSVSPASTASPASNQGRSGGDDAADISLWAKALYTSTDLRGATKMDSDGYGFIIGADGGTSGDLYLGAALGYTHNKGDTDLSHFKSETYLGYLYGRYALTRKTGLTGTIGYGFTQFDLDAANDKFNAHTINAQVAADYALPAHLTAEIAARYTFSAMDAYTTGTTKVAAQDTHTGTVLAGLRYRRNVGGLVVKANAGALYDVYSDAADYRLTQSGVASYARGERLHRFGGEVGAGIGCEGEAFGVEADYNAQVRKDYNDQTVSVKLVYRFNAPKAGRKTAAGGKVTAVPATPAQHKVAEPIASPVQNKVDAPPAAVPASPTPVQNKVDAVPAAPVQHKVAATPATPAQHKVDAVPAAPEVEIIEAYCVSMRRALRRYHGIEAE